MNPSNNQADQLHDLIVAVKHASQSIDALTSGFSQIAFAIEQADSYTNILTIAENIASINTNLSMIDQTLADGNEQTSTVVEKLSDIAESLDYLAATKPDKEV